LKLRLFLLASDLAAQSARLASRRISWNYNTSNNGRLDWD